MKGLIATLIGSLLFLVVSTVPATAETVHGEYSKKLQALKSLKETAQNTVNPTNSIVFPQVANGSSQGLRVITSVVITNVKGDPISVLLTFRTESGNFIPLTLFDSSTGSSEGFNSSFTITVPAFGTMFLETDGLGVLTEGWAIATTLTPESMGGVAALQLIVQATDQFLTIVGVGASASSVAFSTPVFKDTVLNSNTAIAIANNSSSIAYLQVFLFGNDGSSDSTTITIGPSARISLFFDEIFSSVGSLFFGTIHFVRVSSSGEPLFTLDVHPIGLFLSNGILTSIPITNLLPL
ncbi:hypothetical protein MYX82_04960 [Acidobacteria bacterium AH-259-D05]|nr:hypothetical protein [Acidobacteria bacterium AH-259-D05]